jgi:hypothetical protein
VDHPQPLPSFGNASKINIGRARAAYPERQSSLVGQITHRQCAIGAGPQQQAADLTAGPPPSGAYWGSYRWWCGVEMIMLAISLTLLRWAHKQGWW